MLPNRVRERWTKVGFSILSIAHASENSWLQSKRAGRVRISSQSQDLLDRPRLKPFRQVIEPVRPEHFGHNSVPINCGTDYANYRVDPVHEDVPQMEYLCNSLPELRDDHALKLIARRHADQRIDRGMALLLDLLVTCIARIQRALIA